MVEVAEYYEMNQQKIRMGPGCTFVAIIVLVLLLWDTLRFYKDKPWALVPAALIITGYGWSTTDCVRLIPAYGNPESAQKSRDYSYT